MGALTRGRCDLVRGLSSAKMQGGRLGKLPSLVASTNKDGTQVEVTWEWVASHVPSLAYCQVIFELLSYMW